MKQSSPKLLFIIFTLTIATLFIAIATYNPPLNLFAQTQISPEEGVTSNCRYGLAALGNAQVNTLDTFGAGTHLGFKYSAPPAPNNADFVPMIRFHQNKDLVTGEYLEGYTTTPIITSTYPTNQAALRYWLEKNPGQVWIMGNEIDRGPNDGQTTSAQDDMQPYWYAVAYHDVYQYIKQYDPTATIATSALVQVTPARLAYWDEVLSAYQSLYGTKLPVDVWTMHLYILPEVNTSGVPNGIANYPVGLQELGYDPSIWGRYESGGNAGLCSQDNVYCFAEHDSMTVFAEQIIDMRTWMKNHGEQQKPLLITEYSLLYPYEEVGGVCDFLIDEYGNCFDSDRVETFMENSFTYLESAVDPNLGYAIDGNRLVQQWFWFAIHHTGAGDVSNLFNDEALTQISQVGTAYADWVHSTTPTVNLLPTQASFPSIQLPSGMTDVDVPIKAWFTNNGNLRVTDSFDVTFYSNAGLTNVIGTATVTPSDSIRGCATSEYTAEVIWTNLPEGTFPYWAKVDNLNAIGETNEGDNVISGTVNVTTNWLGLPIIRR